MLLHPLFDQPLIQTLLWGVPFFLLAVFAVLMRKCQLNVKTVLMAFVGPAVILFFSRFIWGLLIVYPGDGLYDTILLLLSVLILTYYIYLFEYLLYRFVRHCIMTGNEASSNSVKHIPPKSKNSS